MVRHADGAKFQPLKYSTRAHSEYRTVVHVTVQLLRPNMTQKDVETWQNVADIFNHVFANDLAAQNVRLQGGKHWRDQYVHRFVDSRPAEWREITKPDEEHTSEEMARRDGYKRRICAAAQALGIRVPVAAVPPPTLISAPTVQPASTRKGAPKRAASSPSDSESSSDGKSDSGADSDADFNIQPTKKPKVARTAAAWPPIMQMEENSKRPLRKAKNWEEVEVSGGDAVSDTYEDRFQRSLPRPGSSRVPDKRFARAAIQQDEDTANSTSSTRVAAGKKKTTGKRKAAVMAGETAMGAEDEEEGIDPSLLDSDVPPPPTPAAKKRKSNNVANTHAMMMPKTSALKAEAASNGPSSLSGKGRGKTTWVRSKAYEQRQSSGVSEMSAKQLMSGSRLRSSAGADDGVEGAEEQVLKNGEAQSALPAASNEPASTSAPPPLPMIHGGSNETYWVDGVPHAQSTWTQNTEAAAILHPSSLLIKRGGLVLRGVVDEVKKDVMVCVADECTFCDPIAGNSALASTARKTLDRPLVHACCVSHDGEKGVDVFKPVEGIGYEWTTPFPNNVRSAKVQFNDGVVREVFVCVTKKCTVCSTMATA